MARKGFGGMDLTSPVNRITGKVALALNVRGYWSAAFTLRSLLTDAILAVSAALQTIARLNDSTPAGPVGGFIYILKDIAGNLYSGLTGALTPSATGLSANPVSIVTFRPNTSVQPWAYIADSAPSPNVTIVSGSFHCAGMLKVRSDGLVRKMGIKEPQSAPTVTFPGGGSGPAFIFYKYVYRASETGALSNPGPVSIPGTNSQSSPSETIPATDFATNYVFNATQYEFNSPQIRTKGGVAPGTTTDFIFCFDFGFTIPDGTQVASVTGSGGSGMTPGTYPLVFTGGSPTVPATGTITVLTATTYTIALTNDGTGYTSPPSVTAATGGTPPSFDVTMSTPVTINGIQVDLNWVGQNSGTGVLSSVVLYYLGSPYGTAKFPGIPNQSFSTDTLQGAAGDTWGATLSAAIVNDPSFGFGVQITTQQVGGSDRSFVNSMGITVYYSTQDADVVCVASSDPQVDKIDIYRQGGGLANFTYVGTIPNSSSDVFNDILSDLGAAANPILQYDNFEPVPSIDLPRSGTLTASGQILTQTSGDLFNIRWLPGTIIQIGAITQVSYTSVRRPTSTTSWDFTQNDPSVPAIPDGVDLTWNIAEPGLAQQPLPYMFGPTDNINFIFLVGDPDRPGTLYWCKGSNLDSAPDTNQMDVTDPSEPLVNGAMSGGRGVLFSIRRAWVIMPNFFNAEATATGTSGSTWTLQATSITRGLFIPRCLAVSGGGTIMFRVDDGIHLSPGGLGSESITDGDLYNLFSHEGSTPTPIVRNGVTIYPPDDSQPQNQQISYNNGFWYYDYAGTDANYHTLVFDESAGGWIYDLYAAQIITHEPNEAESVQGVLAGCADRTLRMMTPTGTETGVLATLLTPAVGGAGWQFAQEVTVEYSSNTTITLSTIAADVNNGSYGAANITLPSTSGTIAKTKFLLSPNKYKLAWFQFTSTDPTFRVYTEGFAVRVKNWGSKDPYKYVNPFMMQNPFYPIQGGYGGENA
jgi:hypothetical protein